jgi:nitroreductase
LARGSAQDWAALEQALVLTPSSFGLRPWAFLVIDDPAIRACLILASYGQPQVVDGMDETARRHWATNQTYIALGNLVTSAALLGIDAAPMEGFERHHYDDILGLKVLGLTASVIAAVGYRKDSDKYATAPKVRFPLEEMVQHV